MSSKEKPSFIEISHGNFSHNFEEKSSMLSIKQCEAKQCEAKQFQQEKITWKFRLQELEKYGFELFIDPSMISWMFIISPISVISFFP